MGKTVIIGLIAGVVLGVGQSLIFSTESGFARAISDLALAVIILGCIVGVIRTKWPHLGKTVGFGAAAGLVLGGLLSLRSGIWDDMVQLCITGAILGLIVHFAANALGPKSS